MQTLPIDIAIKEYIKQQVALEVVAYFNGEKKQSVLETKGQATFKPLFAAAKASPEVSVKTLEEAKKFVNKLWDEEI